MYAQFMAQASHLNKRKRKGLLCGARTWFATWFYAMHRLLQQRQALKATIHNQTFIDLPKTNGVIKAVRDTEDNNFWKHIYVLLCALFSSLKALRLHNTNVSGMDKIYYLVHRACAAVAKSVAVLNDETLFGTIISGYQHPQWHIVKHINCSD